MQRFDLKKRPVGRLTSTELATLIQKGRSVGVCKREWKRRWGVEYPLYKSSEGIKPFVKEMKV